MVVPIGTIWVNEDDDGMICDVDYFASGNTADLKDLSISMPRFWGSLFCV